MRLEITQNGQVVDLSYTHSFVRQIIEEEIDGNEKSKILKTIEIYEVIIRYARE